MSKRGLGRHRHEWVSIRELMTPATEDPRMCRICGARQTVIIEDVEGARKATLAMIVEAYRQPITK